MARRESYYNSYGSRSSRRRRSDEGRSLGGLLLDGVMTLLSAVVAVAVLLAWLAPFIHPARWSLFPVLGLIAPAIYILLLCVLLYWIIRWRWRPILFFALLLVAASLRMPLFFRPELRRTAEEERSFGRGTFTVMTFNVRGFRTADWHLALDEVTEQIRRANPDILCLQEVGGSLVRLERIDSLLPDYTAHAYICHPGTDRVSLAIFSRYKILKNRALFDGQTGRAMLSELLVGKDTLRVVTNHLHTTAITMQDDEFLAQGQFLDSAGGDRMRNMIHRFRDNAALRADEADSIAREVALIPGPKIVCGDFNDTPMSYTYRRMASGLEDAFSRCGHGYSYTFRGFMNALRIDYLLYSEGLESLSYRVLNESEAPVSDHYPVVARFRMEKETDK